MLTMDRYLSKHLLPTSRSVGPGSSANSNDDTNLVAERVRHVKTVLFGYITPSLNRTVQLYPQYFRIDHK
jgi:hypothetical protein